MEQNLNSYDSEASNRNGDQLTSEGPSVSKHATEPLAASIAEELENRLAVGQVMKSVEDAYLLYCKYAHAKGFSVKKGDQCYFTGTIELQAKEFECSCQGVKDRRCSIGRTPCYQKSDNRTQCKARFRIGRERGGEWKVTRFLKEHNHEMVAPDQAHLLRSSRNISHAQRSTLEALVNAGIPMGTAILYMEGEFQGTQNLGFTEKEASDLFGHSKRHSKIESGDATDLVQYFMKRSNNEPLFYWNMQVGDDNRAMNFLFRDNQSKVDFEYFGDVLSIDTTYRMNRYGLICVPFVGINHHGQNVIFGLAFMSDETETSYEWLFKTFLKSMGGKQPETIFTDQSQTMMNAIDAVFPLSHHRISHLYIHQNAPSHLGSINYDSRFTQLWNYCTQCCDSEEEFEVTWRNMIDSYNLSDHGWLSEMYELRYRWATAFSNKNFSAGLLATSGSEGTSSVLEKVGNKTISLYNFVLSYEKILKTWRANEKMEDIRCLNGQPETIVKNNPLLDHGADVYTSHIFNQFQSELLECVNIEFIENPSEISQLPMIFKMRSYGEDSRVRTVVYDEQKEEISCSCQKFQSLGILCCHILKVFNFMGVQRIPERYIKSRWTKNARERLSCKGLGCESGNGNDRASETVFVNQKMRMAYDLVMQCKSHPALRNILTECFDSAVDKIKVCLEGLSSIELSECNNAIVVEDDDEILVEEVIGNPHVESREATNAPTQNSIKTTKRGNSKASKKRKELANTSKLQGLANIQPSPYPFGQIFQAIPISSPADWVRLGGNLSNAYQIRGPDLSQG